MTAYRYGAASSLAERSSFERQRQDEQIGRVAKSVSGMTSICTAGSLSLVASLFRRSDRARGEAPTRRRAILMPAPPRKSAA
jgi:hypothetical protein